MRAREFGMGIGAALRSPLWITGSGLQALRQATPDRTPAPLHPERAIRVSARVLRVLARVPFLPWRNTCLYRSVAECLVLRACGIGCRLELGVSREEAAGSAIVAHAWVERTSGTPVVQPHVVLRPTP
jgi:hypothetical protein